MKESNLSKQFLPIWQQKNGKDSHLFRNNTGAWKDKFNRWTFYGIGLLRRRNKKSPYRPVGGGDLIGWSSKESISPTCGSCENFYYNAYAEDSNCAISEGKKNPMKDLCEFFEPWKTEKIAIFTSIELKTKGVVATQDQKDWKDLVIKSGGIAEIVREGEPTE